MMDSLSLSPAGSASCADYWIAHPRGRLFARVWSPPAAPDAHAFAPIVLLHDSLGCVELWRDFPARLAVTTGHTVIAYDRLGFGRSSPRAGILPGDFIADEAASFFPAVLEQLGVARFVVFGHSAGGGMAVHCAARHSRDCEGLISESAQAFVEARTTAGVRAAKHAFADPAQFARLVRYHGDKADWVLDAWTKTWLAPGFATWTLAEGLLPVTAPALIIHGGEDEFGTHRQPEAIAALCSGPAALEIIPDTRHVPHREHPSHILRLVATFLAKNQARSRG